MYKPGLPKINKRNYKQGYYNPANLKKYIGNPNNIRYLSNLELLCFRYMDNNNSVLRWGSEIIQVPYWDVTTNKKRIYFVDIYAEYINKDNTITKAIIEIKPSKQTLPPKGGKYYKQNAETYLKNKCKWDAANVYAKSNGMTFLLLTEEQLR